MTSSIINSFGLVFDIVGVVVLFYFGPPPLNITRDGHKIPAYNSHDENEIKKNKAMANKHHRLSKLGLALLGFGFVLQLSSNWLK